MKKHPRPFTQALVFASVLAGCGDMPPDPSEIDLQSGFIDGGVESPSVSESGLAPSPAQILSIVPSTRVVLEQRGVVDEVRIAQDRSFNHSPFQSTGYWVKAGDALRVAYRYTGAAPSRAPEIWIHGIEDDTWDYRTAQKVVLRAGETTTITASRQGIVYIATFNAPTGGEMVVDLVSGGRVMPRFIAGEHASAQWREMLSAYSSAPYAEIVGRRMMVTTTYAQARLHVDDANALMTVWDEIVRLEGLQYGIVEGNAFPHAPDPHRYHFVELPPYTGWMYAWQYRMAAATAATKSILNSVALRNDGWGPWHELGHHHQPRSITWDDQTEVTVNLSSAYVQRAFGRPSRFENDGYYEAAFAYLNQSTRDFAQQRDPFVRAIMFWQLDLAFGADFYAKLGRNIRNVPTSSRPYSSDERTQFFVLEASRVAGYDLVPFFERWGVPVRAATRTAITGLRLRALTVPIWLNRDTNVRYRLSSATETPMGAIGAIKLSTGACLATTNTNPPGATTETCADVPRMRFVVDARGAIHPIATPDLCLTAAPQGRAATFLTCDATRATQSFRAHADGTLRPANDAETALDFAWGTTVISYSVHGGWNQVWRLPGQPETIARGRITYADGRCLTTTSTNPPGASVETCANVTRMQFDVDSRGAIHPSQTPSLCMTATGTEAVRFVACEASRRDQVFTAEADGTVRPLSDPSKALDLAWGTTVITYPAHGGTNQRFRLPRP